jgi:hypothetical protein
MIGNRSRSVPAVYDVIRRLQRPRYGRTNQTQSRNRNTHLFLRKNVFLFIVHYFFFFVNNYFPAPRKNIKEYG